MTPPGNTLEAADGSTRGADLAKIHAHAATVLAHLGKVVDAAVDAHQAVGHGVDKAAGELVIGLAGVAHGRRGHGDLELAEHVVKTANPFEARLGILVHGKVQGDAKEHLLRALERRVVVGVDHVALNEQIEAGVGEQLVARGLEKRRGPIELSDRIGREDIRPIQALVGEMTNKLAERVDAERAARRYELTAEREPVQACRDELPARRLLARELDCATDQGGHTVRRGGVRTDEGAVARGKHGKVVDGVIEVPLDTGEDFVQSGGKIGVSAATAIAKSERTERLSARS